MKIEEPADSDLKRKPDDRLAGRSWLQIRKLLERLKTLKNLCEELEITSHQLYYYMHKDPKRAAWFWNFRKELRRVRRNARDRDYYAKTGKRDAAIVRENRRTALRLAREVRKANAAKRRDARLQKLTVIDAESGAIVTAIAPADGN